MADNFNARLYMRGLTGSSTTARAPTTSPPAPTTCAPPCYCGLLECLCRPRFFAGQLLTEQDLNRLDAYIRAKNKLHNLQLFGWGVVNGLQVRCEPCGTGVVVGTGYALSPCGDDIIVCGDTTVDVCALVKRCEPTGAGCATPVQARGVSGCDDIIEDWVLAIHYTEMQTRGVTALRMGNTCGCGAGSCSAPTATGGCGCGKASAGSCGNGSVTTSAAPTIPPSSGGSGKRPRGASAECEPTVICEGYAFDVFRAPSADTAAYLKSSAIGGALVESFLCCIQPLIATIPTAPTGGANAQSYAAQSQAWVLWCCRVKEALIAYFSTGPEPNCTLLARLQAWSCPSADSKTFAAEMTQARTQLFRLLLDAIIYCLCSALLPPASCGTSDDRVPLALVRVRKRDCQVVEVCNWTSLRKQVLTFPTLEYWLSWIPWLSSLADTIGSLCCSGLDTIRERAPIYEEAAVKADSKAGTASTGAGNTAQDGMLLRVNPQLDAQQASNNGTFTQLISDAFARGRTPVDPNALIGGLFGIDTGAAQPLSAEERANPGQFLLLNTVLRPLVASLAPAAMTANAQSPAQMMAAVMSGGTAGANDQTAALTARVAALEAALEKLQQPTAKKS